MATTITAGNATNGAAVSSDNTGILELKTGTGSGTTGLTLDASQNVGIGTSSPSSKLNVYDATSSIITASGDAAANIISYRASTDAATPSFAMRKARGTIASPTAVASGDTVGTIFFQAYGGTNNRNIASITGVVDTYTSDSDISANLRFATSPSGSTTSTERMRITAAGEVYIAGTTDQGAYNLQCNGTGVWGAGAYVNGSDERIKEDIAPITSGLDVVTKLNPVTYRYKEDWSKDQNIQPGFIAQEMLAAMEGQNYVDGVVMQGGAENYYSVAYQNIIPLLTKAIQELKAELDATKAEIAALKGAA